MRPQQGFPRLAAMAMVLVVLGSATLDTPIRGQEKKDKEASNNKGKIEGTKWSSVASTVKGQALPAGALKLEFGKDGKLVYNAGSQTFTGKYTLGAGDKVTLHLDQELAGSKEHIEKVVIKDEKLTMTDSDGTAMTFDKVK